MALQINKGPELRLVLTNCDKPLVSALMGWQEHKPTLLVSYYYYGGVKNCLPKIDMQGWMLDSGAFSAFNSGKAIDLSEYIEFCKQRMADTPLMREIIGLDVIGDHKATQKNVDMMWTKGIPAQPTFHIGEPWSVLKSYAKTYPKICVGGVANLPRVKRDGFFREVFARAWPARIHGLGIADQALIRRYPWHSVDAASWALQPKAFGLWRNFDRTGDTAKATLWLRVRGRHCLKAQVEWHLRLEREMKSRWAKEMTLLESIPLERRK